MTKLHHSFPDVWLPEAFKNKKQHKRNNQHRVKDFVKAKQLQQLRNESDPSFYKEGIATRLAVEKAPPLEVISFPTDHVNHDDDDCSEISLKGLAIDDKNENDSERSNREIDYYYKLGGSDNNDNQQEDSDEASLDVEQLDRSSSSSSSSSLVSTSNHEDEAQENSQPNKRHGEHSGSTFPIDDSNHQSLDEDSRHQRTMEEQQQPKDLADSIHSLSLHQPTTTIASDDSPQHQQQLHEKNERDGKKHGWMHALSQSWHATAGATSRKRNKSNQDRRIHSYLKQQQQQQQTPANPQEQRGEPSTIVEQVVS